MTKFYSHLKSLGYGTVIKYKKQLWFFCQGQSGDIVMAATNHGIWHFVGNYNGDRFIANWKNYKVAFSPKAKDTETISKMSEYH